MAEKIDQNVLALGTGSHRLLTEQLKETFNSALDYLQQKMFYLFYYPLSTCTNVNNLLYS